MMVKPCEISTCDVLVVGAGGAGMRAAIAAAEAGAQTTVVCKSLLGKAHTVMAEGGIAAAFGIDDSGDDWETHFADTMLSGKLVNDWRMVEIYATEVLDRVRELEHWGGLFDRTADGRILQRAFGAHSFRRLCHVGDRTGLELIRTLQDRLTATPGVTIHMEHTVMALLKDGDTAAGALCCRQSDGRFIAHRAGAVVLASGGWGRMYRDTSNSWEGVGDGPTLALRAGAELIDMEFVQFHPTGMVWPPGARGLLVTEAVRGEGGVLRNNQGDRFMSAYDPGRMELSSRDVVARAIHQEVAAGRGSPHGGVYLDVTHRGAGHIRRTLPSMHEQFQALAGVDITSESMEVGPTVHYAMGGVRVDPETAASSVPGLYAAGEVAGGLHGANRLGGNSLGDILVYGSRAGAAAAGFASARRAPVALDGGVIEREQTRALAPLSGETGPSESSYRLHEQLQEIMQRGAGIARTGESLDQALREILELRARSENLRVGGGREANPGWHACRELVCMLTVSEAIVRGAIERRESRGAHWRLDFPDPSDEEATSCVVRFADAGMSVARVPVRPMPDSVRARLSRSRFAPSQAGA